MLPPDGLTGFQVVLEFQHADAQRELATFAARDADADSWARSTIPFAVWNRLGRPLELLLRIEPR